MYTYDDVLRLHAFNSFTKAPQIPDQKLFIGEAEQLSGQPNLQLLAGRLQPASKALIDPQLEGSVEDMGLVGDGTGIVNADSFLFGEYALGNPFESEV